MEPVKLVSPNGVRVTVAAHKEQTMKNKGFVRADQPQPAPKRRGRPPKSSEDNE